MCQLINHLKPEKKNCQTYTFSFLHIKGQKTTIKSILTFHAHGTYFSDNSYSTTTAIVFSVV